MARRGSELDSAASETPKQVNGPLISLRHVLVLLIVANFCFDLLVLHVIDVFHCFVDEIGEARQRIGLCGGCFLQMGETPLFSAMKMSSCCFFRSMFSIVCMFDDW